MGNDNKINDKGEVLLFLQEELIPLRKKKEVTNYDLEHEYAKTRKNKDISIWLTLGITLAVVVGITWAVITKMSATNREIEVSLDAFEDLNLRNLFNALSKTQDLYEKASKTKAELQAGLDSALTNAQRSRDTDLEYIKRLGLSKKQRSEREERVLQKYRDAVQAAHDEYDEKLVAADIELKQYEEQLKSFDSENVEKAQKWENEMDSQRQVHELEIESLTKEYEATAGISLIQGCVIATKEFCDNNPAVNLKLTGLRESEVCEVLGVLLDNALEATQCSKSPAIAVEMRNHGNSLEIVVRNSVSLDEKVDFEKSSKPGHEGVGLR